MRHDAYNPVKSQKINSFFREREQTLILAGPESGTFLTNEGVLLICLSQKSTFMFLNGVRGKWIQILLVNFSPPNLKALLIVAMPFFYTFIVSVSFLKKVLSALKISDFCFNI